MTSGVLSAWDLFWVVPVGIVALVLFSAVRAYRRPYTARPSWREKGAGRAEELMGWVDAFPEPGVAMFALVREAKLRREAWNVHVGLHLQTVILGGLDECPSCGETRAEIAEKWHELKRERGRLGTLRGEL